MKNSKIYNFTFTIFFLEMRYFISSRVIASNLILLASTTHLMCFSETLPFIFYEKMAFDGIAFISTQGDRIHSGFVIF